MKKLLLALLILPLFSFGQFSLRPTIGGGYGTVSQEGSLTQNDIAGIFIQSAEVSAIYSLNNWYISMGIGYLATGYAYKMGNLTIGGFYPHEPATYLTNVKLIRKYEHLVVPVSFGRRVSFGKFSIQPEAGIDIAYNLSERSATRSDQNPNSDFHSNDRFSDDYKRLSFFACVRVAPSYQLSDKLTVFCGPSYSYMLGSIVKQKTNSLTGAAISQTHQAILITAGLEVGL